MPSRERLADDGNERPPAPVIVVDRAASPQGDLQGGEELRRDEPEARGLCSVSTIHFAGQQDEGNAARQHHRKATRVRCGLDTRQGTHAGQDSRIEVCSPSWLIVLGPRQLRSQRKDSFGREAGRHRLHAPDRSDQQPRRDQERDRHGDFDGHERRSESLPLAASSGAVAQGGKAALTTDPQRGNQPEAKAGERRESRGDRERAQVDARPRGDRERGRHELREQRHGHERRQRSRHSAEGGEDDALGHHLPHEPLATGT